MKTKILSILALLLMTVTQGAWAQETLTVFDGKGTNQYIPMYGIYFDSYTKSECIIPASELTAMEGGTITAITFYAKSVGGSSSTFSPANQKVFLKEVSGTTLDGFSGMTDATVVFDGTLPMPTTTGGYTITFSKGYTYNGGNLLIGVYNDVKGSYNDVTWYGKYVQSDRVSAYGADPSSLAGVGLNALSFLPKTTFTYATPDPVDLGLPSGKKWADMNVGAGSETGIGTYFEWGETTAYDNNNSYSGNNPTTLPLSNDAAYANWGSNWRMPTKAEYDELLNETYTTWTWYNDYNNTGVGGYLVTSKTNGNSIFLPKTGYMRDGSLTGQHRGDYWSSTINGSVNNEAYALGLGSGDKGTYNFSRSYGFPVRPVQMFAGEGTEASPYLIASTTDWDNLSAAVNGGETYSGKYFKMTANVGTVSTTVGTGASAFNGTFDGNGHTLNVNISNSNEDTRTAPFAWAGGSAVIKNLHVTGSLTNTARTSGIVGSCYATTQISSCRVSATISGGNHTSGISISGGQITNCLFDGKINGTGYTAGFATHVADGTKITNCLFKPQDGSSIPSNQGCFYTSSSGNTPTLTNCYYTSTAGGTAQGENGSGMTAAQLVENLGPSNWKVVDGNAIPKVHPGLSGEGTEASPYLIASTTDWNNLVSAVNGGEAYSGTYFQMTANVGTVSTWMTGTFSGTFDGDGNTLTVGYSSSASGCAPFGNLRAATIKNLIVDGTISTSGERAGGIAWWVLEGNMTYITNCRVSATINSTVSGGASTGGFVGSVQDYGTDGKLTITGCAFTGSLLGSSTNTCGGFVGWNGGTLTIENSLFAPASVTMGTTYSATFTRGGTVTNSYYTQKFNEAQGTQARTIAAGDYVSSLSVTKGNATATYAVSGITVYSGGIDFNDGSTTTFYGGSGQEVSLALTAETRTGYQFKQYAASQGTLSDETTNAPTLTMPAANSTANDVVTISAEYDPLYNATFADGNDNTDWTINPTSGVAGTSVTVSYTGENKVKSVTVAPKGALTGKFSISSTKQVQFSKGNLQYNGSAWSFHTNQYDCVFTSISTATDYPMDIFCWGNIDAPAYDGKTGIGTNGVDLSGSSDWGSNTITNGCTGWRTLTLAEWEYLFANHSYGYATVAGQTGVIILPDVFTDPMRNNGSAAFAASTASWTANVYAAGDDWTAMEKAGALFLPAAGGRDGSYIGSVGIKGSYWSSTAYTTHGHFISFEVGSEPVTYYSIHGYGKSVRLVKDVVSGPVAYQECPNDQHPHWIDLGLSSGTLWQCCNEGATVPEGYGSYYSYNDAQSYNPPTKDQIQELLDNTNSGWTRLNGVYGRWFTSNKNGGKVFLPAAGYIWTGGVTDVGDYGNYWSSTPVGSDSASALNFDSSDVECNNGDCSRLVTSVRPVRKN